MELVDLGLLDEEDVIKQKALNDRRSSKLGAILADSITQKVIVMILVMIIILPLLTYTEVDESSQFLVDVLMSFNLAGNTVTTAAKQEVLSLAVSLTDAGSIPNHYLLQLSVQPMTEEVYPSLGSEYIYDSSILATTSNDRLQYYYAENATANATVSGIFNDRILAQTDSLYQILLIIFVGIMMVMGSIAFTSDAERLVLRPIERMMNMVEAVAANPLAPLSFSVQSSSLDALHSSASQSLKILENKAKGGSGDEDDEDEDGAAGGGGGGGGRANGATTKTGNKRWSLKSLYSEVAGTPSVTAANNNRTARSSSATAGKRAAEAGDYETHLLETTIEKITGLLRVGFGEAGANIISANLALSHQETTGPNHKKKAIETATDNSQQKTSLATNQHGMGNTNNIIDPLLPGIRVYAIFGFCDIHHFEDINARLASEVLVFVNSIAEIVHCQVHGWGGQCNKNLGNAFVVVWRIGDEPALMAATQASIASLSSRKKLKSSSSNLNNNNAAGSNNGRLSDVGSVRSKRSGAPNGNFNGSDRDSSASYDTDDDVNLNKRRLNSGPGSRTGSENEASDMDDTGSVGSSKMRRSRNGGGGSGPRSVSGRSTASGSGGIGGRRKEIDLKRVPGVDDMAQGALTGYLKIIVEINRAENILKYRKHPLLTRKKHPLILPSEPRHHRMTRIEKVKRLVKRPVSSLTVAPPAPAGAAGTATAAGGLSALFAKVSPTPSMDGSSPMSSPRQTATVYHSLPTTAGDEEMGRASVENEEEMVEVEEEVEVEVEVDVDDHEGKQAGEEAKASHHLDDTPQHFHGHGHGNGHHEDDDEHEDFKVRMGFGLHAGWAIEGAVGSIFKVDATYLSPHVNMAARLETASRQYRVPLLMSHVFHELLSDSVKEKCRQIDCVTVKGSEVPIGIYTYDSYMDQRFLRSEEATMTLTAKTLTRLMSVTNANFMASPSKKMSLLLQNSAATGNGAPGSAGKRGSATTPAALPHRPSNSNLSAMGTGGAGGAGGASSSATKRSSTPSTLNANGAPSGGEEITPVKSILKSQNRSDSPLVMLSPADDISGINRGQTSSPALNMLSASPAANMMGSPAVSSAQRKRRISFSDQNQTSASAAATAAAVAAANANATSVSNGNASNNSNVIVIPAPIDQPSPTRRPSHLAHIHQQFAPSEARKSSFRSPSQRLRTSSTGSMNGGSTIGGAGSMTGSASQEDRDDGNKDSTTGFIPLDVGQSLSASSSRDALDTAAGSASSSSPSGAKTSTPSPPSLPNTGPISGNRDSILSTASGAPTPPRMEGGRRSYGRASLPPIAPMSVHHSATARLLLNQVHKELKRTQRLQEELLARLSHYQDTVSARQAAVAASVASAAQLGGGSSLHDLLTAQERDEQQYQLAMEHLRELYPDAEVCVPPHGTSGGAQYEDSADVFDQDIDLLQLQSLVKHFAPQFTPVFNQGMQEYLKGNWSAARSLLEEADTMYCEAHCEFVQQSVLYYCPFIVHDEVKVTVKGVIARRGLLHTTQMNKRRQSLGHSLKAFGDDGELLDPSSPSNNNTTPVDSRRLSLSKTGKPVQRKSISQLMSFTDEEKVVLGDGPCQTLLSYMKDREYTAPADWKGFRPLTSK